VGSRGKAPSRRPRGNTLRIIGGSLRGRKLRFPDCPGLRPTADRVRETLFNWVQADVVGAHCLDAFAGSGALGFEAFSRGADAVTMVEKQPRVAASLRQALTELDDSEVIRIIEQPVEQFLATDPQRYDLVFLDPPFGTDLYTQSLALLATGASLRPGAKIYIECARHADVLTAIPTSWQLLREKAAGQVEYRLFQAP